MFQHWKATSFSKLNWNTMYKNPCHFQCGHFCKPVNPKNHRAKTCLRTSSHPPSPRWLVWLFHISSLLACWCLSGWGIVLKGLDGWYFDVWFLAEHFSVSVSLIKKVGLKKNVERENNSRWRGRHVERDGEESSKKWFQDSSGPNRMTEIHRGYQWHFRSWERVAIKKQPMVQVGCK